MTPLASVAVTLSLVCASAPRAQEPKYDLFKKIFVSAREVNDTRKMVSTIKKYPKQAIRYFRYVCDSYCVTGKDEFYNRVEQLKKIWGNAYKSSVLQHCEDYLAELDEVQRKKIRRLERQQNHAYRLYEKGMESKKKKDFEEAVKLSLETAEAYAEIGDKLRSAENYTNTISYLSAIPGGYSRTKEGIERTVAYLEKYDGFRRDMDWTADVEYRQNVEWLKALKIKLASWPKERKGGAKGKPDKDGGPASAGGGEAKAAFLPGSKWTKVDLTIGAQKLATDGMHFFSGANPMTWLAFTLKGTTPYELPFFKDAKLNFQRLGANKYVYLPDVADPKSAKHFKPGGVKKAVWIDYEKKGVESGYPFFFWIGSSQEQHVGTTMNFAPQWSGANRRATIFIRSAARLDAEIEGTRIEFFDENCNGIVGEDPDKTKGWVDFRMGQGMEEQGRNPYFDSMRLGGSKKLQPFSRFVKLGEQWYRLVVNGNNEALRYRPLDPDKLQTGRVALKWKGKGKTRPDFLVITETGFFKGAAFDISEAGSKGIEVPVGTYELFYGRIINGKPPRDMNAVIQPGDMKSISIAAGQVTTLTMGAPFRIEYKVERDGRTATVNSSTF
ncbi:MAG: hypothetical protein ACE5F1_19290, partial [Planctomycetota bacterium]